MRFSAALALLVPAFAANITVLVGSGGLVYTPSNITAQTGDFVEFEFRGGNHTVTQSTFTDPCTQFRNATTNQAGLDSGFQPVAAGATQFPVWTIQITETSPIWMFCAQGKHCANGMVFSINANESSDKSFAAYKARAQATLTGSSTASGAAPSRTGGASRVMLTPVSLALVAAAVVLVL
ncbi:hypothetical protein CTheo_905 [Ceratobasidium theobromae]|uniref:Phytocyanin domain-containing protein n=1 Tax=Ceratobasidium theobromae TaxID=1582974 RepID=A0A5N5QWX8_9AGAM|nr:hypothetical protein CTheo_905 [Ceratobasidium theobromae]